MTSQRQKTNLFAWQSENPNKSNHSNCSCFPRLASKTILSKSSFSIMWSQVINISYSLPNNRWKWHKIFRLLRRYKLTAWISYLGDNYLRRKALDTHCHAFPQRQKQIFRNNHIFSWQWIRPQSCTQVRHCFCIANT